MIDTQKTLQINQHICYQHKDEIPLGLEVRGPIYRRGQHLEYIAPDSKLNGKVGFVNNILYAPNVDHYYQRVRVNTGNYSFIESASKFWTPTKVETGA